MHLNALNASFASCYKPQMRVRIKELRDKIGITQGQLASRMVGVADQTAISRIERGEQDVPVGKLEPFAEALEATPLEVLGLGEHASFDHVRAAVVETLDVLSKQRFDLTNEMIADVALDVLRAIASAPDTGAHGRSVMIAALARARHSPKEEAARDLEDKLRQDPEWRAGGKFDKEDDETD